MPLKWDLPVPAVPGTWGEQGHPGQHPTWVEGCPTWWKGGVAGVKEPLGPGLQVLIQSQFCTNAKPQAWRTERTGFPPHPDYTGVCPSPLALQKSLLSTVYSFGFSHFVQDRRVPLRTRALAMAPSEGLDHLRLACMDTAAFPACVHLHLASRQHRGPSPCPQASSP